MPQRASDRPLSLRLAAGTLLLSIEGQEYLIATELAQESRPATGDVRDSPEDARRQALEELMTALGSRETAAGLLEGLVAQTTPEDCARNLRALRSIVEAAAASNSARRQDAARALVGEYELRYHEVRLCRSPVRLAELLHWLAQGTTFATLWSMRGDALDDDLAELCWGVPGREPPLAVYLRSSRDTWPTVLIGWFRDRLRPDIVLRAWRSVRVALDETRQVEEAAQRYDDEGDAWSVAAVRQKLGPLNGLSLPALRHASAGAGIGALVSLLVAAAAVAALWIALPAARGAAAQRWSPSSEPWMVAMAAAAIVTGMTVKLAPQSWWIRAVVVACGGSLFGVPGLRDMLHLLAVQPRLAIVSTGAMNAAALWLQARRARQHQSSARIWAAAVMGAGATAFPTVWAVSLQAAVDPWRGYTSLWPWLATWLGCQAALHLTRLNEDPGRQGAPPVPN